jgi:hypothetical protein
MLHGGDLHCFLSFHMSFRFGLELDLSGWRLTQVWESGDIPSTDDELQMCDFR